MTPEGRGQVVGWEGHAVAVVMALGHGGPGREEGLHGGGFALGPH